MRAEGKPRTVYATWWEALLCGAHETKRILSEEVRAIYWESSSCKPSAGSGSATFSQETLL
jgi:hypothetical protein